MHATLEGEGIEGRYDPPGQELIPCECRLQRIRATQEPQNVKTIECRSNTNCRVH
jgi:hypothetical protein